MNNTATDGRLLLHIRDTCHCLGGLSRSTVYELINAGELVRVKIGARGFVTAESVAAYVDRLTKAAASTPDSPVDGAA